MANCPIDLNTAKWHLHREGYDDDNALIASQMEQATDLVEKLNGRTLSAARTRFLYLDAFPVANGGRIELPWPPAAAVTSIKYLDTAGAEQTLAPTDYRVDVTSFVGRVTPAYGLTWPDTYAGIKAVTIEYTAGYATASGVPPDAISAILRALCRLYENRGEAPLDIADLLLADRVF